MPGDCITIFYGSNGYPNVIISWSVCYCHSLPIYLIFAGKVGACYSGAPNEGWAHSLA